MAKLRNCVKCTPEDGQGSRFSIKRGKTRHKDGICSRCRLWGGPSRVNYKGRAA